MALHPVEGDEVKINYVIKANDTVIDSTGDKLGFCYSCGGGKVYDVIDKEVKKMTKGEKKLIDLSDQDAKEILLRSNTQCNDSSKVTIQVELLDFYPKIKSVYEMDTKEKVDRANEIKVVAATEYKQNEFQNAITKFKEAFTFIEKIPDKEIVGDIFKLKVSLLLNQCNCHNRLKQYDESIKVANEVIRIDNESAKGHYYRGVAYANLDEFEKAENDYKKLVEILKADNDAGVIALKNMIDSRQKEKNEKEKNRMKSLLKKGIYDDIK